MGIVVAVTVVINSFNDVFDMMALAERCVEAQWFLSSIQIEHKSDKVQCFGGSVSGLTATVKLKACKQSHRITNVTAQYTLLQEMDLWI